MNMNLARVSRRAAVAAMVLFLSFKTGIAAAPDEPLASPGNNPLTIKALKFPKRATFKRWSSTTGQVGVCKRRCGRNGQGSGSPYDYTDLYGSRYISVAYGSSATFVLKTPESAVAFIWGTPDVNCNSASFYDSTGTLIGVVDASEIPATGYYSFASTTPISSIVFSEADCDGDVYFEIAQGPFPYNKDADAN